MLPASAVRAGCGVRHTGGDGVAARTATPKFRCGTCRDDLPSEPMDVRFTKTGHRQYGIAVRCDGAWGPTRTAPGFDDPDLAAPAGVTRGRRGHAWFADPPAAAPTARPLRL